MARSPSYATPATTPFTTWAQTILPENTPFWKPLPSSNATAASQPNPCLAAHHQQVRRALSYFRNQVQQEMVMEQQSPQLNPQQTRAIAHLKAFRNAGMTHATERNALDQAIELIKRGRFQRLPNDINKLQRKIRKKPIAPAQQLHALLQNHQ